ncbi:MAG TPA: NAD(P)H-hydrate epimerase [Anaerolineales bacterium]|nr:NAD(P)H-hydrate epimerase [Anaerolineales bacterium]
MKLVTVDQMIAIEREADEAGLTYEKMMNNAGHGLANVLQSLEGDVPARSAAGLVGPGNNGGDALVALTELAAAGWTVSAYITRRQEDSLVSRLRKAGGQILEHAQDHEHLRLMDMLRSAAVILDGLLGTGAKLPVTGEIMDVMATTLAFLGSSAPAPYLVAVDCPSGIDCDTGEVSAQTLPADLTVTMAAVKQGLLRMPACEYVGDLHVVDIGLPADLSSLSSVDVDVADADLVGSLLPRRAADSHKGTFGTALVVAGSVNYTGAALLAAGGAYRAGAGLVTVAVPSPLHTAISGHIPEATWVLLPHELGVISRDAAAILATRLEQECDAILIGPGLGLENTTAEFVQRVIQGGTASAAGTSTMGFLGGSGTRLANSRRQLPPLIVDADGLRLLSRMPEWPRALPPFSVLTPHPGEMAALTGLTKEGIQQDRVGVATRYAREWGHVVVLKGAFTVIASPTGQAMVIPVATAALARAGTGDVLAGVITGLRAQGMSAYDAAVAGAWIHAQAGLHAAARLGNDASVLAGDVLSSVADVISSVGS